MRVKDGEDKLQAALERRGLRVEREGPLLVCSARCVRAHDVAERGRRS